MQQLYKILVLLYLIFTNSIHASCQQNNPIEKIIIRFDKGHNSWGKTGKYSESEIIEFVSKNNGLYDLNSYFRINHFVEKKSGNHAKDTIISSVKKYRKLRNVNISNIIENLDTSLVYDNSRYLEKNIKSPTRKKIRHMAKLLDEELFFDKDFKKENRKAIKKIKRLENFKEFYSTIKPNVELFQITVDLWDLIEIKIIKSELIEIHRLDFLKSFGQPIQYHSNDNNTRIQYVNLKINRLLQKILPKDSLSNKAIGFDSIKQLYIEWWFEKYYLNDL